MRTCSQDRCPGGTLSPGCDSPLLHSASLPLGGECFGRLSPDGVGLALPEGTIEYYAELPGLPHAHTLPSLALSTGETMRTEVGTRAQPSAVAGPPPPSTVAPGGGALPPVLSKGLLPTDEQPRRISRFQVIKVAEPPSTPSTPTQAMQGNIASKT